MPHSYKPLFCGYVRKFVVTTSAEMTKGYIDTLLSFQILLIFRAKFSYLVIFSPSVLETAVFVTNAVLLSLSMNCLRGQLKSTVVTTTPMHSMYNYTRIPETNPVSRV